MGSKRKKKGAHGTHLYGVPMDPPDYSWALSVPKASTKTTGKGTLRQSSVSPRKGRNGFSASQPSSSPMSSPRRRPNPSSGSATPRTHRSHHGQPHPPMSPNSHNTASPRRIGTAPASSRPSEEALRTAPSSSQAHPYNHQHLFPAVAGEPSPGSSSYGTTDDEYDGKSSYTSTLPPLSPERSNHKPPSPERSNHKPSSPERTQRNTTSRKGSRSRSPRKRRPPGTVSVAVRIRPLLPREYHLGASSVIHVTSPTSFEIVHPQSNIRYPLTFSSCYAPLLPPAKEEDGMSADAGGGEGGEESPPGEEVYLNLLKQGQVQVYEGNCRPCLERAFAGQSSLVVVFGQAVSGKSFTVGLSGSEGASDETSEDMRALGVLPLLCRDLFDTVNGLEASAEDKNMKLKCYVRFSIVAVHNKCLHDLLGKSPHADADRVEWMEAEDLQAVKRIAAIAAVAQRLSRLKSIATHTIVTISLVQIRERNGERSVREGKIHVVDLAASGEYPTDAAIAEAQTRGRVRPEFVRKWLRNGDAKMRTAAEVNSVTAALRDVHRSLTAITRMESPKAPRSKLLYVLKGSLTKHAHVHFIATISPSSFDFWETVATLEYTSLLHAAVSGEDPPPLPSRQPENQPDSPSSSSSEDEEEKLRRQDEEVKKLRAEREERARVRREAKKQRKAAAARKKREELRQQQKEERRKEEEENKKREEVKRKVAEEKLLKKKKLELKKKLEKGQAEREQKEAELAAKEAEEAAKPALPKRMSSRQLAQMERLAGGVPCSVGGKKSGKRSSSSNVDDEEEELRPWANDGEGPPPPLFEEVEEEDEEGREEEVEDVKDDHTDEAQERVGKSAGGAEVVEDADAHNEGPSIADEMEDVKFGGMMVAIVEGENKIQVDEEEQETKRNQSPPPPKPQPLTASSLSLGPEKYEEEEEEQQQQQQEETPETVEVEDESQPGDINDDESDVPDEVEEPPSDIQGDLAQ